jgi:hypothetical protein
MGPAFKDVTAAPLLKALQEDPRSEVTGAAATALKKLGTRH